MLKFTADPAPFEPTKEKYLELLTEITASLVTHEGYHGYTVQTAQEILIQLINVVEDGPA